MEEKEFENCYLILGILNFSSIKEISKAYKSLILKFHPDKQIKNIVNSNLKEKELELNFIKIRRAYEILSNEETKLIHDQKLQKKLLQIEQVNEEINEEKFNKKE